ncbi:hypothetical protein [Dactylosporangium sp. CA-092794]|uniref:hypothetical protein n=1 Tax=Dactylosporangium sp. CA-092794 TaxID=3239929 RepID=UPI003D9190B4
MVNDAELSDDADRDVARIRALHVDIDHGVLDAYGWSDFTPGHGFHTFRKMQRWTVSPAARIEILDRLLDENRRRAERQRQKSGGAAFGAGELDDDGALF